MKSDRRYGTARWRRIRQIVLNRDLRCWFTDCPEIPTIADHIQRVTSTTTDSEFFDTSGLRGSCKRHNLARTLIAIFETAPPDRRLSRMGRSSSMFTSRPTQSVVTRDYSR